MTVKEFNELLNLITIQDGMEKLDTIRQQQIIEIDEIWDKIEEFQDLIENLEILLEKNNIKKETQLIKTTRKKVSRLKVELECKQDFIMQEEFETGEILSDLYYKRRAALDELYSKEIKLEKLGVLKIKTGPVKESNNLGNSSWWGCFNIKERKQSYLNKSLIVYFNRVLLGFYVLLSKMHSVWFSAL